mmetsp:Transcript_22979/g.46523  ORF Transcript_22979/g.46523 Transcript_22979/m.46523 type:complete len:354 (-) Transcript_22979:12-1073(-)
MGTKLAICSSLIYFVFLRLHFHIYQRPWCTHAWQTTDCHSAEGVRVARGNDTDLKVVLPSYGQTGTSSVTEALRVLGLRTFHADDFSTLAKPVMFDGVEWDFWAETVSRCRMEAMSLEPVTDSLPIAVAKAPKAKFILTWRTFPSWLKSTSATRIKEKRVEAMARFLTRSNSLYPWVENFDYFTGAVARQRREGNPFWGSKFTAFGYIYRTICNGYAWPVTRLTTRGTYKNHGSEEAYLAHVDEIRQTVPRDRLFEFDVRRHGWAELEYMVFGTKSGVSRGPFPQPRSKDMRTNEPLMETYWNVTGPAYYVFTILHALNFSNILLIVSACVNVIPLLRSGRACGNSRRRKRSK